MQEWGVINSILRYKATEKQVIASRRGNQTSLLSFPVSDKNAFKMALIINVYYAGSSVLVIQYMIYLVFHVFNDS